MSDPVLIQSDNTISLLIRNRLRGIPDMDSFDALGIQSQDIKKVSPTLFARIPRDEPIISLTSITSCPSGLTCANPLSENEKKIIFLYKIYLNRDPDQGGFDNFLNMVNSGTSTNEIKKIIISSAEFIQKSLENADAQTQQIMTLIQEDTNKNKQLAIQQDEVKQILETEQENIDNKQQLYEKNSITQQRETILQQNSSDRTKEYNYMMFVVVFGVAGLIILQLIEKHLPIFPDVLLTILRIAIIGGSLIWIYAIFSRIQKRDPLNYQKLDLGAPTVDTPEETAKKIKEAEDSGNLLATVSTHKCSGNACCGPNTQWDDNKMLCVPTETFSNIKPNEPTNNYTSI